jgi:hypothetical protein
MVKIARLLDTNLTSYVVFHPSIPHLVGDCSEVTLIIKNLITRITGNKGVQFCDAVVTKQSWSSSTNPGSPWLSYTIRYWKHVWKLSNRLML